jgi:hypothetical protein
MALPLKWVDAPPPRERISASTSARVAERLDLKPGKWAELACDSDNEARDCAQWLRKRGYEATVRGPVLYARAKP